MPAGPTVQPTGSTPLLECGLRIGGLPGSLAVCLVDRTVVPASSTGVEHPVAGRWVQRAGIMPLRTGSPTVGRHVTLGTIRAAPVLRRTFGPTIGSPTTG
jgi:hypothetical protein